MRGLYERGEERLQAAGKVASANRVGCGGAAGKDCEDRNERRHFECRREHFHDGLLGSRKSIKTYRGVPSIYKSQYL
jgi:hypothetical protein